MLCHHFNQIAQAELVAKVPANTQNDDFAIKMSAVKHPGWSLRLLPIIDHPIFGLNNLTDSRRLFAPEPFTQPFLDPLPEHLAVHAVRDGYGRHESSIRRRTTQFGVKR
ncbi:hypothetical protein [Robbsia andropogonis]|uniref:hypothetical protein n=2 Tax=Robbsia andropogonis TaxID=28092 RepID=UPI000A52D451|nr:hypothetical protein [Robbsia andropogonis]